VGKREEGFLVVCFVKGFILYCRLEELLRGNVRVFWSGASYCVMLRAIQVGFWIFGLGQIKRDYHSVQILIILLIT
jgi:hypothetical protein